MDTDGSFRSREHAIDLLLEVALDDLLLLFRFLLVGSENQFAVERHRLEQNVEPFAVFVGKCVYCFARVRREVGLKADRGGGHNVASYPDFGPTYPYRRAGLNSTNDGRVDGRVR